MDGMGADGRTDICTNVHTYVRMYGRLALLRVELPTISGNYPKGPTKNKRKEKRLKETAGNFRLATRGKIKISMYQV